jgi:hypothetical protein
LVVVMALVMIGVRLVERGAEVRDQHLLLSKRRRDDAT